MEIQRGRLLSHPSLPKRVSHAKTKSSNYSFFFPLQIHWQYTEFQLVQRLFKSSVSRKNTVWKTKSSNYSFFVFSSPNSFTIYRISIGPKTLRELHVQEEYCLKWTCQKEISKLRGQSWGKEKTRMNKINWPFFTNHNNIPASGSSSSFFGFDLLIWPRMNQTQNALSLVSDSELIKGSTLI